MRLSYQENFGCRSSDEVAPTYIALAGAPARMQRSVALVNHADRVFGFGFDTYEDRPVTRDKFVIKLLLLIGAFVTVRLTWSLPDVELTLLVAIGLTLIANWLPHLWLRLTVAEWSASRLLGTPVRPRRFIREGRRAGFVAVLQPELAPLYQAYNQRWRTASRADRPKLAGVMSAAVAELTSLLDELTDPQLAQLTRLEGREKFDDLVEELESQFESSEPVAPSWPEPVTTIWPVSDGTLAGDRAARNYEFRLKWDLPL